MNLSGPVCSVDRLTLLLKVSKLCLRTEHLGERDIEMRTTAIKKFHSVMLGEFDYLLDQNVNQGDRTELYLRHYRFKNGVDLQISPRFPVKVRIDDEGYIKVFGTALDEERGYIDEYYDPEYSVRLEFNPNKNDLREISPILLFFKQLDDIPYQEFIKVSRLDIAIDYPLEINPALIDAKGLRKGFVAYGSNGIETVYFGSRESAYYFRIYDKKKELFKKNKLDLARYQRELEEYEFYKRHGGFTGEAPERPEILDLPEHLWRVELEFKEPFFLGQFPESIYTQFDRLKFFAGGQKTGDWILDMVLYVASQFQLKGVLAMMPRTTAFRYKQMLLNFFDRSIQPPAYVFNRQFPEVWKTEFEKILYSFGYKEDSLAL